MKPSVEPEIVDALTVDVEDYFQVSALEAAVPRSAWGTMECRVERNVERLLSIFDEHGARATFFTLGWIAERWPRVVRSIVAHGHELASHGYDHRRANRQTRAEFTADVEQAKAILEQTSGVVVQGYRAPSFSFDRTNPWVFDALAAAGYRYSSSVYPVRHDHYGMPDAPRFPYHPRGGSVLEIPVSTLRVGGRNLPIGGGGYFRLLPYAVSRRAIERLHRSERRPAVFYLHPWEIDPGQRRIEGIGAKSRFRHYVNLSRTEPRLQRLLDDFRWDTIRAVFDLALGHERLAA